MMRFDSMRVNQAGRDGRKYLDMRSSRQRHEIIAIPLLTFLSSVGGNKARVTGGYWRADGIGEWHVDTTILTLTGATEYGWVRKTKSGDTLEIGHSTTRPAATSADSYYRILFKAVAWSAGHYGMTEQNWGGGDFNIGSPLRG